MIRNILYIMSMDVSMGAVLNSPLHSTDHVELQLSHSGQAFPLLRSVWNRALPLCGKYCGPGWCNGQKINEDECCGKYEYPSSWTGGENGPDDCCRSHDYCCGSNQRACESGNKTACSLWGQCNAELISCFDSVSNETCGVGLTGDTMKKAMSLASPLPMCCFHLEGQDSCDAR
mmetsp:Transcript_23178/g.41877  ORF Transcript_23178/g.41877 Transcript_23178/m.41877 type:complete len:174 (-) Transcript_23178:54-575(-)